ncbi:MAG: ATP-binding protein, partial [Bacteroidales bacterium]|nr:ATP-binding protein [Bacteroidales bacterium]
QLFGKDLIVFLKANYTKEFYEKEVDRLLEEDYVEWLMPKEVVFRMGSTYIDGEQYRNFTISDYPLYVDNAWGSGLFNLDRTKIVINFKPVPKFESERQIDRSLMETETKLYRTGKSSTQIELQTHLETLRDLLGALKNNNEQLYEVNTHIVCEESAKKEVRAKIREQGFRYSEMFGRQVDAFISTNISRLDNIKEYWRGIPTTTYAAIFPFVSSELQDPKGFYLGEYIYPVFINFFMRNDEKGERVNSNVMIIGKSGSGKSYATKMLLANLAADNSKIFVLDPEDEYTKLSKNMRGKMMDVGSSQHGIFNPFHVMTTLEADEGKQDDSLSLHLQFLEQFFRIILDGLSSDAFELLNSVVTEVYKTKGITSTTQIKDLKATDFPIFDDLLKLIHKKVKAEKDAYKKQNFQTIETYIEKFATGGRNSNLWNGATSIETKENFITFNFRSLIANRNQIIASAQMLLVFKYLDNEIIKNREFNLKYATERKIIIVVDEAHVFINPKFPIALDFMAQMAKRIRKYSGMQIIITQNIKDFVGSEEIQRQSTAIINASQYSLIFSLAPNDMSDLVELYRNAGEINEEEQNSIVTAPRGCCFLITGPLSRTMVNVIASKFIEKVMGEK